jgi:hypothetical protein
MTYSGTILSSSLPAFRAPVSQTGALTITEAGEETWTQLGQTHIKAAAASTMAF